MKHGLSGVTPGLCERCSFVRRVANQRDSEFYLCERSRQDARFPKYPQLPVLTCVGFEAAATADEERK